MTDPESKKQPAATKISLRMVLEPPFRIQLATVQLQKKPVAADGVQRCAPYNIRTLPFRVNISLWR
jgi:hypothetical protein